MFATIFFVLVGDGTETSMLGYEPFLMKTDGHVTRLLNSLHILGVDYGRNREGCSFFLGNSKMHLIFPKFTISDEILAHGDLRIQLETLTDED